MTDQPFRTVPVHVLLQTVARARAAGDWRRAEVEWQACIARAKPRVERIVDIHVARDLIGAAERDDVVQDAIIRAGEALVENLDSLSEAAFFAAMATCAKFQCWDEGRRYARRKKRQQPFDAPEGDDRPDPLARRLGAQATRQWERGDEIREAGKRVDELIARLRDPRARKLLTLQRLGLRDHAIADELGVSMDNLYQIRSRALRELRGIDSP